MCSLLLNYTTKPYVFLIVIYTTKPYMFLIVKLCNKNRQTKITTYKADTQVYVVKSSNLYKCCPYYIVQILSILYKLSLMYVN